MKLKADFCLDDLAVDTAFLRVKSVTSEAFIRVCGEIKRAKHVSARERCRARESRLSRAEKRGIGHFRVVFCLCFKTSPSAKPFI